MATDTERVRVVGEFFAASNRYDIDAQLLLLADDSEAEIPGLSLFQGKDQIKKYLQFGQGLRQQQTVVDCWPTDDGIICNTIRKDDWLTAAGISEFPISYEFRFRRGLISSIRAFFSPHEAELIGKLLEGFVPWALAHHPHLFTPDGDFDYGLEMGSGLAAALGEWQSEREGPIAS